MRGGEVAEAQAGLALEAEGVEGLFPLCVLGVVGGVVTLREDTVLEVVSLLDDRAELVLSRDLSVGRVDEGGLEGGSAHLCE